jgi:ribonuclease P/MRP protein subunit RPP1
VAISRGIYFEIKYTPALGGTAAFISMDTPYLIVDSNGRRYFFANSSNLIRVTKGKHIIFSSGAERDMLLRSPYDIINLGILTGLTYGKAMDAVSSSCVAVIAHGGR